MSSAVHSDEDSNPKAPYTVTEKVEGKLHVCELPQAVTQLTHLNNSTHTEYQDVDNSRIDRTSSDSWAAR